MSSRIVRDPLTHWTNPGGPRNERDRERNRETRKGGLKREVQQHPTHRHTRRISFSAPAGASSLFRCTHTAALPAGGDDERTRAMVRDEDFLAAHARMPKPTERRNEKRNREMDRMKREGKEKRIRRLEERGGQNRWWCAEASQSTGRPWQVGSVASDERLVLDSPAVGRP